MNYFIKIIAKSNPNIAIEKVHEDIIRSLKNISNDWGLKENVEFSLPDFKNLDLAKVSLFRKFKSKSIKGDIIYSRRNQTKDHHFSDDIAVFDFNASKVDVSSFLSDMVYKYIEGFNAYGLSVFPEGILYEEDDTPMEIRSEINYRNSIDRFDQIVYYSNEFIRRALDMDTLDLYNCLIDRIFHVEYFKDGILIKAANRLLDLKESKEFNEVM